MNTETGQVVSSERYQEMLKTMTEEEQQKWVSAPRATDNQLKRGKVGNNEKCPCGSGVKFKFCHKVPRSLK